MNVFFESSSRLLRNSFLYFPACTQPYWTLFTGKPLPNEKPIHRLNSSLGVILTLVSTILLVQFHIYLLTSLNSSLVYIGFILTPVFTLFVTGNLRRIQVVYVHHAIHMSLIFGKPRANLIVARILTIFVLCQNEQDYKTDHLAHHKLSVFTSLKDVDAKFLQQFGVCQGRPYSELKSAFCLKFISLWYHLYFFYSRIHSNICRPLEWRVVVLLWVGLLFIVFPIKYGVLVVLLSIWLPLILVYQISAFLQILTEHIWLVNSAKVTNRKEYANRCVGRFCGEMVPGCNGRSGSLLEWFRWWLRMLFIHLPVRICVIVGDLPAHDWHHVCKPSKQNSGWSPSAIYARQKVIDNGDLYEMEARELWGIKNMVLHTLHALESSDSSPGLSETKFNEKISAGTTDMKIFKRNHSDDSINVKAIAIAIVLLSFPITAMSLDKLETGSVYQSDYFIPYNPKTAADMVSQVPGFTLVVRPETNVRGLGRGLGNLLIDGKRPNTKDSSADDLLRRIPANTVTHIKIISEGSTELPGQSGMIVDLVTHQSIKLAGSWSLGAQQIGSDTTKPHFEVSLTKKNKNISSTMGLSLFSNSFPRLGPEIFYDALGVALEFRDEHQDYNEEGKKANLGFNWSNNKDKEANLTLFAEDVSTDFHEVSERFNIATMVDRGSLIRELDFSLNDEDFRYEVGGDFSSQFGSGKLKLIGLTRHSVKEEYSVFKDQPVSAATYFFQANTTNSETENVLKALYTLAQNTEQKLVATMELVENRVDIAAVFREDSGKGFQEVFFKGSDVLVTEERQEVSLYYSRPINSNWAFQSLVALEHSEISAIVSDGDVRSDSFSRAKGFVGVSGSLNRRTDFRARLEKSVSQLSFLDFASTQDVIEGTSNEGNIQLVPEQKWRAELTLEHNLSEKEKLTLVVYSELIKDFITFTHFDVGTEGRGNIGELRRNGLDLDATLDLERIGINGGKLDIFAHLQSTNLFDPITGKSRAHREGDSRPLTYQIRFRQDVPGYAIAWGAKLLEGSGNTVYRLNQKIVNGHAFPQSHILFIEHKNKAGMTVKLEAEDFLGYTYENRREFFDGDRSGDLLGFEENTQHAPRIIRLTLSGNF